MFVNKKYQLSEQIRQLVDFRDHHSIDEALQEFRTTGLLQRDPVVAPD